MEKEEAKEIALEKSKLLLEYIEQFMSDNSVVGHISIVSGNDLDSKEAMCYIEIMLNNGFERVIKTDITAQQSDVLSEQILIDIAERYACDEDVFISKFYTVKSNRESMHGISIGNNKGCYIRLNFLCRGIDFDKVVEKYSMQLITIENRINRTRGI